MIFNQTIDPFFDYFLKRFSLRTNIDVDLSFEKNFVHKLKYPYSECKVNSKDLPNSIFAKKLLEIPDQKVYMEILCKELG